MGRGVTDVEDTAESAPLPSPPPWKRTVVVRRAARLAAPSPPSPSSACGAVVCARVLCVRCVCALCALCVLCGCMMRVRRAARARPRFKRTLPSGHTHTQAQTAMQRHKQHARPWHIQRTSRMARLVSSTNPAPPRAQLTHATYTTTTLNEMNHTRPCRTHLAYGLARLLHKSSPAAGALFITPVQPSPVHVPYPYIQTK